MKSTQKLRERKVSGTVAVTKRGPANKLYASGASQSKQNRFVVKAFKKRTFLAIATEWDSRHGGLSTFNRELCIALAKRGHRVFCYVPDSVNDETKSAAKVGVTLITAPDTPGAIDASRLYRLPKLSGRLVPDIIIGHDRHTGAQSISLAEDHFPGSKRIHFIHTDPTEIEYYKTQPFGQTASQKGEERQKIQVRMCGDADIVAAVGPRLRRGIGHALHNIVSTENVIPFIPGLNQSKIRKIQNAPLVRQCLVLGRAEDAVLKGLDLAARAMGLVQNEIRDGPPIELVVRGVPDGEGDKLKKWMEEIARNPSLKITPKEYTNNRETLKADILKSSLVLMPSKTEGFGLVGLEAIDLGVPVLLSEKSGLAEYLRSLSLEESQNCVATVRNYNGQDEQFEQDARAWSTAIGYCLRDLTTAFNRAWNLREKLKHHMNWNTSVERLCELLDCG